MFDIGWGKIVIIAVIALIVIGPKELPAVLRTLGQWMGRIRRMAAEFQGQFQEAMREAEMADLKKSVDAITEATRDLGKGFDPLGTVHRNIEGAFEEKPAAAVPPPGETPAAAAPAAAAETAAVAPETPPAAAAETPAATAPVEPASAPTDPLPPPTPAVTGAGHPGAPPPPDAGGRAA